MQTHLAEDGYVIDTVVIGQRLNKPIAEARLPHAHRPLVLLSTGQTDNSH